MKSSGIGGQAVIEGVMMKNKNQYAVAVRTPDQKIVVDKKEYQSFSEKHKWARLPFVRGVVNFAESMSIGMQTLTYSASFYEEEEERESKVEKAFAAVFKEKAETVVTACTVVLAIVLAIGIFMLLPWFIAEQAGRLIDNPYAQAAVEGVLRIAIFVLYVFAISLTEDIRRVYMYHGAEHKTINCVENGLELTVENVKTQSREHKRCGTSFLLYVMVISILFFMFIRVDSAALRVLFRLLLIPVVAGVSYEFIRLAGNSDNPIVNLLSRPGMWMQALTTREPDDSMIEVAIQSVEAVFNWKAYLEGKDATVPMVEKTDMVAMEHPDSVEEEWMESEKEKMPSQEPQTVHVAVAKKADKTVRRGAYFKEPIRKKRGVDDVVPEKEKENASREPKRESDVQVAVLKKAKGVRRPMQPIEELQRDSILLDSEQDDEDDEVLSALDKFFE